VEGKIKAGVLPATLPARAAIDDNSYRLSTFDEARSSPMKMPLCLELMCLACIAAAAQAADYPNIKAGLWSTTTVMSDAKRPPQTGTMCNNTAVMQSVIDKHKKTDQPCKITSMSHSGSVYTEQTECNVGGQVRKSTSVTTFTGDTLVHTEIHQTDGSVTVTSDSKYVGACPAGMVPGDFVGADGLKFNILHPEDMKAPDEVKLPAKKP
jgi:hypothetical protein